MEVWLFSFEIKYCMTNINKHIEAYIWLNTEISKYSCTVKWIEVNNYFVLDIMDPVCFGYAPWI